MDAWSTQRSRRTAACAGQGPWRKHRPLEGQDVQDAATQQNRPQRQPTHSDSRLSMNKKRIEQLSKELARISGVRLRPPQAGEDAHSPAGELRSMLPPEFFHWWKCPWHDTWLQPRMKPYPHWACCSSYLYTGHGECDFKKPAKMRTKIEQRIFRVHKFLEELA